MNILITGVHGFVGSNIVPSLKDKHTLYGLDITTPEREGVTKTFTWKELEDAQLPEVDVIIHLAGKAHDIKGRSLTQSYFDINTGLTQKVFDYFLQSSAKKFIYFSSIKAAADRTSGNIITEDVVPMPKGPYGESKIKAEEYIQNNNKEEKQVYILRPCMIHGPGNKGNLNLLYNIVKKGLPWPLSAFNNRRSFTSIDNLCFIMINLLEKELPTGIYHIGDDEPLSTNDLINLIVESVDKREYVWKIHPGIIKIIAKIGDVFHLPLTSARLMKLTEDYVVSNRKIKTAIGVDKLPVSAKEGMRKTFRSFKQE